jgi:hypothetical protein
MAVRIDIVGSPAPVPSIWVPWTGTMNVQQLMEAAYNQVQPRSPAGFTFALQYFGTFQSQPLGYLAVMVDGAYDLPDQRVFWALKVNGRYATRGIDYTVVVDGDVVTLSNEVYDAEVHTGTHVEVKLLAHEMLSSPRSC